LLRFLQCKVKKKEEKGQSRRWKGGSKAHPGIAGVSPALPFPQACRLQMQARCLRSRDYDPIAAVSRAANPAYRGGRSPLPIRAASTILPLKTLVPAFLALHPQSPAKPLDWKGCRQGAPDRVIIACTSIVDLGGVNDAARAVALIARGRAYAAKKQLAKALEDLRQATLLDPRNPDGFYAIAERKLALERLRN
jgi:tetratricopeptide (TPR) repeat protein